MATVAESNSTGRKRQEERRIETRTKLVDAAIKLLHNKGASQLTTQDVAREAGMTRGAIQYHFDSPKSLLVASINEIAARLVEHLNTEQLKQLPLQERLDRVFDEYWRGFQGEAYTAFMEITMRGRNDPEFSAAITSALDELERKRALTWQEIFADTGRDLEEIVSWRSTLMITFRGLALTRIIAGDSEKLSPQIERFKDMFKQYLTAL
ncbi:TetR/AcrR family transcriptional regulator [Sneathiella marina]|uniref:TetR/AcrR family transcriptional regulator n=1 Tax=Sneathiella marina TaxID=2950108 RepID=A0ABY4W0J7_9PROT|nr:TetR/AcrR family transcriptional regulator [Sneathiella marina]USG60732.1 TetR/AcrR family transcriptional regulator [Sneathiella marina]